MEPITTVSETATALSDIERVLAEYSPLTRAIACAMVLADSCDRMGVSREWAADVVRVINAAP